VTGETDTEKKGQMDMMLLGHERMWNKNTKYSMEIIMLIKA